MEKFYITTNQNAANQLLDLLNTEFMAALNDFSQKKYTVQVVEETYDGQKFKVYNENDVFKGWVRIIKTNRDPITNKYADLIVHKDGGQYAIPIIDNIKEVYDIDAKVKEIALQYGYIHNGDLPEDWFEQLT